jgi:hypothetical protein
MECKIAGIVCNDYLWASNSEQKAERTLQALCQSIVDNNHCIIPQHCRAAYMLGAPLVVVEVMARHNTSAKIQEYGCELLACLSCCCQQHQTVNQKKGPEKQKEQERENESFLKLGGLWRVLRAMELFHNDPVVLGPACWFIGNVVDQALLQQQQDSSSSMLGDCCLQATISAMTAHPTSVAVQEYGCYVLRNYIVRAPGTLGAKLVVDAGGIECVIAAMFHHVHVDVDVLTEGCTVLTKLAEMNLPQHCKRIIEAKGLVALSEIIRIYNNQQQQDNDKNKHKDNDNDDGASVLLVEKASRAMHSILLVQSSPSTSSLSSSSSGGDEKTFA